MRTIIVTFLVLLLFPITLLRNDLWNDDGRLWFDTIDKSPRKARGYNELGLHAIQVKEFDLALKAFTKALQLNPYLSQAYQNIGLAYEGMNMTDMAIATYEKAIRLSPGDPVSYYNLGLLYYKVKHDRQRALYYFLQARDLNPLEPDVHQYLGTIYNEMGLLEQAREELRLNSQLK